MKFMIITGPQAVGKMAVGMKIAELTGLKLFHNHMSIEPIVKLFDYGSKEAQYLIKLFRKEVFEQMAMSNQKGMIFTYVWAFDLESDTKYVNDLLKLFEKNGAQTYIVELESNLEIRINRNETPLRLAEKPTKRNVEWSKNDLILCMNKYRLNSLPGEIKHPNYLKVNNNNLSVDETAMFIIEHFNL